MKNRNLTGPAVSGANIFPFLIPSACTLQAFLVRDTCLSVRVCICVCVCVPCKKKRMPERERERDRVAVGEMTGFGCDLLSYALVIM